MKKAYLVGITALFSISTIFALFGTSNHFLKFVDVSDIVEEEPYVEPHKPNPPVSNKELEGYKCTYESCEMLEGTSKINEQYMFIYDGINKIVLYDTNNSEIKYTYREVLPANNLFIVVNDSGLYGLIKIDQDVENLYETKYTYIQYNEADNHFMVTSPTTSFITDENGKKISPEYSAQIVQYNDRYIITKTKAGDYHIFNFKNIEFLSEYINSKHYFIELVGDYVGAINEKYVYQLYDLSAGNKIVGECELEVGTIDARARIVGNKVEIFKGEEVLKTIDL